MDMDEEISFLIFLSFKSVLKSEHSFECLLGAIMEKNVIQK